MSPSSLVGYLPPRTLLSDKTHRKVVKQMFDWYDKVLSEAPRRTMPIFACDLNDSFGLVRTAGGGRAYVEDRWVQTARPAIERTTATLARDFLQDHDLFTVSAARSGGPTFYGASWSSVIDHFCCLWMPRGSSAGLRRCTALCEDYN